MRILPFIVLIVIMARYGQKTESPHGRDFKISCSTCHSSKGWMIDTTIYSFDHNTTRLPLKGQHTIVKCRECHPSLIFSQAKSECNECHADVHQGTTGLDCSGCHTPTSWLVSNITRIHEISRFPLMGAHKTADCKACHKSESLVRFDVPGVDCIDCHREAYNSTTNPNHRTSGFSEQCDICHSITSTQWTGVGFNHSFFPLVLGHSGLSCVTCHTSGNYSNLSPDCYSCHQTDYNNTTNPNHSGLSFSTQCTACHSTNPGWKPAKFTQHDSQYFPIYSGRHNGTWTVCTECHTEPGNYAIFDCKRCHANAHEGKNYTNDECYSCHPRGTGGDR
jgi:hypothetical protein